MSLGCDFAPIINQYLVYQELGDIRPGIISETDYGISHASVEERALAHMATELLQGKN